MEREGGGEGVVEKRKCRGEEEGVWNRGRRGLYEKQRRKRQKQGKKKREGKAWREV